MVFRSSLVFLTIGLLLVHRAPAPIVGGWQDSTDEQAIAKMTALAQTQLTTTYGDNSASIEDVHLQKQVVAGTNLRLTFQYNHKYQCELTAFQPLAYTGKPIEVKSFNCQKREQHHHDHSDDSTSSSEETKEPHKRDLSISDSDE